VIKLAIGYSTKDQVDLTNQTLNRLCDTRAEFDIYWGDGSITDEGLKYFSDTRGCAFHSARVVGGADASISWKLSKMLTSPVDYTHIMLLENDVLLDEDWFEPTMQLFEKGRSDGLEVGVVSARSYVDRVLIQRDGYAVMHNMGAGMVVFTRAAAQIVLQTFRTAWWPDNVRLFAQLSGIDLRTYAAFRGNEQWTTTDWGWEAQLARHGLASLALTPAKCSMIGQNPPLHEQGLELVWGSDLVRRDDAAFKKFAACTLLLRAGTLWDDHCASYEVPGMLHRDGAGMLFFPHQLGVLNARWQGNLELQWSQGFGPFAYRAGPGGASLSAHISGICSFLASGGAAGAGVTIEDHRSGFKARPSLPPEADSGMISVTVPGGPVPRMITMDMAEGAVFYGLSCSDPQMIDTTCKFSWEQLPVAPGEAQRSGEAK
jgi:hypothetical protein